MKKRVPFAVIALLALTAGASVAARGPSTAEERQKAVQFAHHLESDPLSRSARDERAWFTVWLAEVPDINVSVCVEFYPSLLQSQKNHATELVMQAVYSTAFVIEHPDQSQDENAKYLAGVEGALRAYESILQKEPKAHWPVLDDLLAKREKGELAAFVTATAPKCSKK